MASKKKPTAKRNLPARRDEPSTLSIKLPDIIVKEEVYQLEKDDSLIAYEFNLIELPFFSKDDHIEANVSKKYVFSPNSYMQVFPSSDEASGQKILMDFDEKVFYGIMKLYKKQGKKIITNIHELLSLSGVQVTGVNYERAKSSIYRMKGCQIRFSNSLYSAEERSMLKQDKTISIIQEAEIVSHEKMEEMGAKERSKYEKYFNGRIKEIVAITLSDFIAANIESKGFLTYDADKLIDIGSASARKIYVMVKKWQGWEKKDIIKRSCRFIASRIPLSWEYSNIPSTVRNIDRSCKILKDKGLIEDYLMERAKPLKDSMITFFFSGSEDSKREEIIRKNNLNNVVTTGHEELSILDVQDFLDEKQTSIFDLATVEGEVSERMVSLLPEVARTDGIRHEIEKYLKEKGPVYVESNIRYSLANAKDSLAGYLVQSLRKDYGAGMRLAMEAERKKKEEAAEEKRIEEEKKLRQEKTAKRRDYLRKFYELMSEEDKKLVQREAMELAAQQGLTNPKSIQIAVETTFLFIVVEKWLSEEKA